MIYNSNNKKIKFNNVVLEEKKTKQKNSFLDVIIKFKKDYGFNFLIKENMIKNFNRFINVNFESKNQKQKIEIFLNNFLKINLNNNQNKTKLKCNVIGCGFDHSFIFNEKENKLFLFGNNMYNQLGLTEKHIRRLNSITNNIIEKFNLNFSKIKKFEIGGWHNLILFENNDLYSLGSNHVGQCGINNENKKNYKISIPKKIKFPCFKKVDKNKKIKNIFCGSEHSFVLLGFFFFSVFKKSTFFIFYYIKNFFFFFKKNKKIMNYFHLD